MASNLDGLLSQIEMLKGNPELEDTLNALLQKLAVQTKSAENTRGKSDKDDSNYDTYMSGQNHKAQENNWNSFNSTSGQRSQIDNWGFTDQNSSKKEQENNWDAPFKTNNGNNRGNDFFSGEQSSRSHDSSQQFSKQQMSPANQDSNWNRSEKSSSNGNNFDFSGGRKTASRNDGNDFFSGEHNSRTRNDFQQSSEKASSLTQESNWNRSENPDSKGNNFGFSGAQKTTFQNDTHNFSGQMEPEQSNLLNSGHPGFSSSSNQEPNKKATENNWGGAGESSPKFEDSFEAMFGNNSTLIVDSQDQGNYGTKQRQGYFIKPTGENNNTESSGFPYDIVEVKLADQQADVNSPLYSVHSFDDLGLKTEVLKGVYGMNYNKPSKIQERALPMLLGDPPRNLIGQSQSGTGKTAAFVISMLSRIDYSLEGAQAICLAPTRELARQIMIVAKEMSKYTSATLEFAIRDDDQSRIINSNIIIGTPGTIIRYINLRRLETKNVKMFILDEADTMLDMQGMGEQCATIKKYMPADCQKVLFSATFPQAVREFSQFFAPDANEIILKQQELSIEAIKQFFMDCDSNEERDGMLIDLYSLMTIGQSIIFVNTRAAADRISRFMTDEGHRVIALHGLLGSEERDQMIDDFRSGKAKVMVTTNVVARGIDISQVNLVINYDMPFDIDGHPDAETYLHRIGRTGRFGRSGVAINLVSNKYAYNAMLFMEEHFGHPIAKLEMTDYEATERILKKALK